MSDPTWNNLGNLWSLYPPPLRPTDGVVRTVARELGDRRRRVLLLGVTPELADIGDDVWAVDTSEAMLGSVWPGDTERRRARLADWLDLPFQAGSFDGAVGDGCLTALPSAAHAQLFGQLARVLRPGGRLVLRLFATPNPCETPESVRDEAFAGRIGSPFAMRWRLAMSMASTRPHYDVPMREWARTFDDLYPDRAALEKATQWDRRCINAVDIFQDSLQVSCFAPAATILAEISPLFENARLVATEGYELAERCPLVVAERAD